MNQSLKDFFFYVYNIIYYISILHTCVLIAEFVVNIARNFQLFLNIIFSYYNCHIGLNSTATILYFKTNLLISTIVTIYCNVNRKYVFILNFINGLYILCIEI
jgi:hypothetical protein